MVLPCGMAAAQAAGAAGSAGATALGLGMGKTDLDLTRDLFKLQMRQAKRLWTADWAEASVRHGESCMQSAQQHAEAQAMATATYYQTEKVAAQSIKLARDQDSRAYEMAWRAEVRESLRDELANQNNRFNIIMLCDTVCLGCVFTLVADGNPPIDTPTIMLNLYVFTLGLGIMLFSVSLWLCVIVVRRLHEHTASILERKLFAQSDDLQKKWQQQLQHNLPTGPYEMYLVNQTYEKWVASYIDPLGRTSIHLLSIGVVAMFLSAGLLIHNTYLIEYKASTAVPIFWTMVILTSTMVLFMKYFEDLTEKTKQGVYDNSWQDKHTVETGPYAKIIKAANELFSSTAIGLASNERMEQYHNREQVERDYCMKTQALLQKVNSLRKESETRAKMRKDVLQLLTTAAEELDALPEELTSRLNKLLHDIDEADSRTANLVTMRADDDNTQLKHEASHADWSRLSRMPTKPRGPMATFPIDAQRIPVSLGSLRKKLGEIPLTTLLRLKNLSDEPLRLKSGVQLKEGKYVKSLTANDPNNNSVNFHLYPVTEIPPRTEVVVAARSSGGGWIPTSNIDGQLVYTNRDETWMFKIKFHNALIANLRRCRTEVIHVGNNNEDGNDSDDENVVEPEDQQYWQISKDELDSKANNEFVISIDQLWGEDATKAAFDYQQSQITLKSGILLKNRAFGLGLQWQQRLFVLTPTEILYSHDIAGKRKSRIPLKDITSVRQGTDIVRKNVFEVHTNKEGKSAYKLSAPSSLERDDWMKKISQASGVDMTTDVEANPSSKSEESTTSSLKIAIECVQSERGTEVLPV